VEKPQFYRNSARLKMAYAGHMLTGKSGIYVVLMAALSYSARGYDDSAVFCSKMSCDALLSEALYEADKVLEKFVAALRECGWRTEQTVNRKCVFYFVILRNTSISSLHLCLRLLCRLLHCCFAANC